MKLLHVDDEPDIREITAIALALDPDIEVVSVESGAAALESISTGAPDVILLDVMMPEMDGPTLLKILRESRETADIPVIFMTAAAKYQSENHLKSIGAVGVITKPFDPLTLAKEVKALSASTGV
ncbi:response regulator [Vannielia sp. SX4]|uniref:response regulator n=1 Tax=Vannielia sp. SX4 TaxID=3463852 RepID=UPI004059B4F3